MATKKPVEVEKPKAKRGEPAEPLKAAAAPAAKRTGKGVDSVVADAPKAKSNGKHPGGRPPVPDAVRLHQLSIRLTGADREKFGLLGGVDWLREQIRKSKVKGAD